MTPDDARSQAAMKHAGMDAEEESSRADVLHRLRNAEALLRMAAKVGRLGAWSFDVGTYQLIWSDEVCAIHEVPPGFRPSAARALGFYAPAFRPPLRAAFEACVTRGVPYDLELQIITARHRRVWVRAIGYAETDDSGNVTTVQGAFQDISGTKTAAENNRLLAERLTMTLESMTDAFFTVDRDWCITYMNTEAGRLLNRDREALIGRNLWEAFPESIGSDFHHSYEHALTAHEPVEMETFYAPQQIWVQLRAYPSPQGLAVSFRDVSDRVRSHEAIVRLNSELEERVKARTAELQAVNKELESFSYSVAHDLRSPLAALNCFGQMIEETDGATLSPRGRHFLERLRTAALQMDSMTQGLLELARLSKTRIGHEIVDLSAIALRVLNDLRDQSLQRRSDVTVQPGLQAVGDRVLLTQLVSNLIGNAWKFTSGCIIARITVGARREPSGQEVFFVRDNGAGFDMSHAGRLFEPFQRLHHSSEYEGTGIGLATVQRIVNRHEGRVWAEAAPGEGATFFFTLHDQAPA